MGEGRLSEAMKAKQVVLFAVGAVLFGLMLFGLRSHDVAPETSGLSADSDAIRKRQRDASEVVSNTRHRKAGRLRSSAAKDLEDARKWAEGRPDSDERADLIQAIEEALCQEAIEPTGAEIVGQLDEAVRRLAYEDSALGLVLNLTQKWAGEDLNAARDWVVNQPDSEIRGALLHRIAIEQTESDPVAAAHLVAEEIPPGPAQTEAVVTVVHRWALHDPTSAAAWAESFPVGLIRLRAQQELYGLANYRKDDISAER
jgi:hypothetical protein